MSEKKWRASDMAAGRGAEPISPLNFGRVPWDDLAAFLAVARQGGLSPAARELGSSAPTLGRRMRALERALGRELFVRRTHGYELTDDGARLLDQLRPAEEAIALATLPLRDDALPLVKIAAGTWTAFLIADMLPHLTGDPPDLRVRLLQGEDVLSIPRREAAIGFRSRRPTEAGLAGRRLRKVEFAPFQAPGAPDSWIVVRATVPSARWVAERCGDAIAAETNTPRLALDLALKGLGRALLPTFVGDHQPGLERAGPVVDELTHDQWLVCHDEDRALPEIRRALDRIGGFFG
ncbi:LysR family transcriptional regulator [Aestuariicoccus sp. MJ-SS9]|uniref:LysR family transcriptional regulator n=1 Tax=Aestuariicoccus sp. MJ-SS9 TaxID=3079855 RepID=UPI00290B2A9B|nr:LysR family transcriptional regulator [Aestuariicoccus sp. MJ-SS9]MDU8914097.1 LysR family transcriptional regulator [Aestuariicoccus sp. MJ-SS9]